MRYLGHLPAASNGTGRVKCFMCWQSLHSPDQSMNGTAASSPLQISFVISTTYFKSQQLNCSGKYCRFQRLKVESGLSGGPIINEAGELVGIVSW